ncbi:hypothetical protein HY629_00430 [Candidatus Uhrbacteria bacterium]|nr:hypothetical protein [Candidatus Uhrbacteria bacterium]
MGSKGEEKPQSVNQSQPNGSKNENKADESAPDTESGNTLRGVLRASNDRTRGNLMLELADSDKVIYLRSSRDFSALYNKEVAVIIDGDLNEFTLLDIKAQ